MAKEKVLYTTIKFYIAIKKSEVMACTTSNHYIKENKSDSEG